MSMTVSSRWALRTPLATASRCRSWLPGRQVADGPSPRRRCKGAMFCGPGLITSISVLNGIVGDAAFSAPFAKWLHETFHVHDRAADISATAMVVIVITVLTIIFGELVPKRLGQMHPETVARLVARPMEWLSL